MQSHSLSTFDSGLSTHTSHPMWCAGLGCSVFARRYLQNNFYFLFLLVLRCFTSQGERLWNAPLDFTTLLVKGFPIQKSPDRRLLGTSPKRIAAWPRLSSLFRAKASTVCSYVPIRKHNYHYNHKDRSLRLHVYCLFSCVRVIYSARPQSDISTYWITVLLRVRCTGFYCQRSTYLFNNFRNKNPPYGGQVTKRHMASELIDFCFVFDH